MAKVLQKSSKTGSENGFQLHRILEAIKKAAFSDFLQFQTENTPKRHPKTSSENHEKRSQEPIYLKLMLKMLT